ncbi:MAG: hypothetical protein QXT00_02480 [Ignisphaera sp.]
MKIKFITVEDLVSLLQLQGVKRNFVTRALRKLGIQPIRTHAVPLDELNKAAQKCVGVTPIDVLRKNIPVLGRREYARKYNIPPSTVHRYWEEGRVEGFLLFNRLFIVDAPPRSAGDFSLLSVQDENAMLNKFFMKLEPVMVRPVALVRVQPRKVGRRILHLLAKRKLLFRFGRFYYVLYDKLGRAPQEIKLIYPNPMELMIPKPITTSYTWSDAEEITAKQVSVL